VCDVRLSDRDGQAIPADELLRRLRAAAPDGFLVEDVALLPEGAPCVTRVVALADLAIGVPLPEDGQVADLSAVERWRERNLDVARAQSEKKSEKKSDKKGDKNRKLVD